MKDFRPRDSESGFGLRGAASSRAVVKFAVEGSEAGLRQSPQPPETLKPKETLNSKSETLISPKP